MEGMNEYINTQALTFYFPFPTSNVFFGSYTSRTNNRGGFFHWCKLFGQSPVSRSMVMVHHISQPMRTPGNIWHVRWARDSRKGRNYRSNLHDQL